MLIKLIFSGYRNFYFDPSMTVDKIIEEVIGKRGDDAVGAALSEVFETGERWIKVRQDKNGCWLGLDRTDKLTR